MWQSGWPRFLPLNVGMALLAAEAGLEPSAEVLSAGWLDAELSEIAELHGAAASAELAADEAGELLADAAGRRDRMLAMWGREGFTTVADVLAWLAGRGVVDEGWRWRGLLPAEVLDLDSETVAAEDRLRWEDAFSSTAQAVIRLFDPHGARHPTLRLSLRMLAEELGVPALDVREALAGLQAEGDFAVSADVATVSDDEPVTITVDWDAFDQGRLNVGFGPAGP
jgi:Family of unknown function (DUF6042)